MAERLSKLCMSTWVIHGFFLFYHVGMGNGQASVMSRQWFQSVQSATKVDLGEKERLK